MAAALSSKYRSYQPYSSIHNSDNFSNGTQEKLEDFLDRNGILLSMCKRFDRDLQRSVPDCRLDDKDTSFAASWVQEVETFGFNVFRPLEDYGVGMVMDPPRVHATCLYPGDAASKARDDQGCGPLSEDPDHGSWGRTEAYREMVRKKFQDVKAQRFPHTDWINITCLDLIYGNESRLATITNVFQNQGVEANDSQDSHDNNINDTFVFETIEVSQERFLTELMGFQPCTPGETEPQFGPTNWFVYVDTQYWRPSDWNEFVSTMRRLMLDHPAVKNWNEVVLEKPKDDEELANMVQAVFYVDDPNESDEGMRTFYRYAKSKATEWGKPLLRVNLQAGQGQDLFVCSDPSVEEKLQ